MATTFLPNKHVGYPALNDTGWGSTINTSLPNIDSALGGNQAFNLAAASGTVAVSAVTYNGAYPANVASYVPSSWTLTGTLTANVVLQVPASVGGQWIVQNNCVMGAFNITASVSGGTAATLESGNQTIYSDGVNMSAARSLFPSNTVFVGLWPGAQSIPVTAFTVLNFTGQSLPSWGTWSGGTMTINHGGTYLINTAATIQAIYTSSIIGTMQLGIYRNGGLVNMTGASSPSAATTNTLVAGVTSIVNCVATDTMDVRAFMYNTGSYFSSASTSGPVNNVSIVKIA